MKTHPKIRKCAKWMGTVLCVVVFVLWVVSIWTPFIYYSALRVRTGLSGPTGAIIAFSVDMGAIETLLLDRDRSFSPYSIRLDGFGPTVWWIKYTSGPYARLVIPFWIPLGLVALPTAYLWRRDWLASRPTRANVCAWCNYDRAGLGPTAPCPECNAAPICFR